jgi:hypothetical protein
MACCKLFILNGNGCLGGSVSTAAEAIGFANLEASIVLYMVVNYLLNVKA